MDSRQFISPDYVLTAQFMYRVIPEEIHKGNVIYGRMKRKTTHTQTIMKLHKNIVKG